MVLEFEAAFHTVQPTPDHDEWRHETDCLEIPTQFIGTPHLAMFGFESLAAARLGVDLCQSFATQSFGFIVHG